MTNNNNPYWFPFANNNINNMKENMTDFGSDFSNSNDIHLNGSQMQIPEIKTSASIHNTKPVIDEVYIEQFIDVFSVDYIKDNYCRPLTQKEFEHAIKLLSNAYELDTEIWHSKTDDLMEKQLTASGFDISYIVNSTRWYA